jgi:K+-sensing histidine kinase KdpD
LIERLVANLVQRLDRRRKHHNDGHGLGLSIVRAITTAHGASITAEPLPEGGLRISVAFPSRANKALAQVDGPDARPERLVIGVHRLGGSLR